MNFASDNSGPVPDAVLDALRDANKGYAMGYGSDALTEHVTAEIRRVFEAPEAAVYLVATGTAANSLALSTLCAPYETVFCSEASHIHEDECNAPEFYTGGAKLTLVRGRDKMTPEALRDAILGEETRGVHGPQRGPVSITNVNESGNVYSVAELTALTDVAKEFGLPVHLDGARFANACAAMNCTPAEMTWRNGVDVVVFGGTKNGLMGVEAVVFFDPTKAWEFELRRKRGAHLFSKHRYLAAQMAAYLKDDLWLDLARRANGNCARLVDGLRSKNISLQNDGQANIVFFDAPRNVHMRLKSAGAVYHLWGAETGDPDEVITGRLVCDWSIERSDIDRFIELFA